MKTLCENGRCLSGQSSFERRERQSEKAPETMQSRLVDSRNSETVPIRAARVLLVDSYRHLIHHR